MIVLLEVIGSYREGNTTETLRLSILGFRTVENGDHLCPVDVDCVRSNCNGYCWHGQRGSGRVGEQRGREETSYGFGVPRHDEGSWRRITIKAAKIEKCNRNIS